MSNVHTPGPWRIQSPSHPNPNQREDKLIFAKVGDEFLHIAEVYQYQNDNNHEADGTATANARLIAKAPEMLEKARACIAEMDKATTFDGSTEPFDDLRALLSEIEGKG